MSEKGNTDEEVRRRIQMATVTWRKLETIWKTSKISTPLKLRLWDALIRSRLVYGIDSARLTDDLRKKLTAFQMKGIRQILKLKTTSGQMMAGEAMTNKHEVVYARAREIFAKPTPQQVKRKREGKKVRKKPGKMLASTIRRQG